MRFRTRLIALITIFIALGLVTATGAFSSVSAERTVSVNTAGDDSALLALEPHQSSPNGAGGYAQIASDGELVIDFSQVSATGVNQNARTVLDYVFNITNQGTQTVEVWITETGSNTTAVTFYSGPVSGGTAFPASQSSTVTLAPGDKVQVSIEIDTRGSTNAPGDQLLDSITIHAEA